MYIAVPRAGGLPDVNVNKFDIYCYVGLCSAVHCPTPLMIPQKLEVHTKELYWGGAYSMALAARLATAATSAAPFPEPSSDSRKDTLQLGARSFSVFWRLSEKLGRTGGESED